MEMKLAQGLAQLKQMPMWATFIDLRKAFDAMNRERLLEILEDRGVGSNLLRLIRVFWEMATFCCRAGGNHGRPFKAFRGVTQGGPLSPRLFNIMVDVIIREWMRQVMRPKAAAEGVGLEVRKLLACFYVDDGIIASHNPYSSKSASISWPPCSTGSASSPTPSRRKR